MSGGLDLLQPQAPPAAALPALDDSMRAFQEVSRGLVASYQRLEQRANYVQGELARKVDELDALNRHFEAILRALPVGVLVRDAQGCATLLNRPAQAILGVCEQDAPLRAGEAEPIQCQQRQIQRPDGASRTVDARTALIRHADGRVVGSVEILDDRTEYEALNERLHAVDKMAALGQMAGGIAHEIRNPLNAVRGFASLLLRDATSGAAERVQRYAQLIVQGADEANAIISSLLNLASTDKLLLEEIDAQELFESALEAAWPAAIERNSFKCSIALDVPRFRGDRIKLRQALRNLIENAIQVQGERGALQLSAVREGRDLVFRVADAGPGVPAELARRIFEPFFTTRAQGTGLGLPLTATLAQLHGGSLSVAGSPGPLGGSEFLLRFPFQPAVS